MGKLIIKSNNIYTLEGVVDGGILIKGKIIEKILNREELENYKELEIVDVGENLVIPGLIDIHIHGSGGWTVADGNVEQVRGLCEYLASVGVTSFKPTLGGEDLLTINKSLKAIAQVMDEDYNGARMLGIHMEGPFLSTIEKGVFIIENLKTPSIELMEEFIKNSNNKIVHVTVAPELEGAKDLIKYLKYNNILVAGGHTDATLEETRKGINWGITLSNHTCNAQRSIHHREPGALGGYLLEDEVYCELICDLFHVHPDMIDLVIRLKTTDKICMISDAVLASGLKPGTYNFSNREIIIDEDGWSRLPDGTIAGSTKSLLYGFKNMVKLGYNIEDVVKMSSYVPAQVSGVADRKGSIARGKDADVVILDDNYKVQKTYVEGKLVFDVEKDELVLNPELN